MPQTAQTPIAPVNPARGFTFVEVLAALAVASIALLGLLRLHLISIRMAESAETTARAVLIAQQKIDETLASGFPEPAVSTGRLRDRRVCFRWRTEVSEPRLNGALEPGFAGLRKVSVDVAWKQGLRRRHLQLSTLVARRTAR